MELIANVGIHVLVEGIEHGSHETVQIVGCLLEIVGDKFSSIDDALFVNEEELQNGSSQGMQVAFLGKEIKLVSEIRKIGEPGTRGRAVPHGGNEVLNGTRGALVLDRGQQQKQSSQRCLGILGLTGLDQGIIES